MKIFFLLIILGFSQVLGQKWRPLTESKTKIEDWPSQAKLNCDDSNTVCTADMWVKWAMQQGQKFYKNITKANKNPRTKPSFELEEIRFTKSELVLRLYKRIQILA